MLSIALSATLPGLAQVSDWQIDSAHTAAQFSVRHMMVSNVRGQFGKTAGSARFDPKDPAKGTVEVSVDAASIDTREPKRDAHIKSADFFDVQKFPAITFRSKRAEAAGAGRIGAVATARISRKEFGMTWNRAIEDGGVAVGDEVATIIDVELVRKP